MDCDNLKKAPLMANITIMKKLKQNETKIEIIFLFNYSFLSFLHALLKHYEFTIVYDIMGQFY